MQAREQPRGVLSATMAIPPAAAYANWGETTVGATGGLFKEAQAVPSAMTYTSTNLGI